MLTIREPFWKYMAFGIAEKELVGDSVKVKCSHRKADGLLSYPHTYSMSPAKIRLHQSMTIKGNKVYIVPINSFDAS